MSNYVEHSNIIVVDAEHTVNFLMSAIPEWRIRGKGSIDNWFGKDVDWYHVGDDNTYITIQNGGEGVVGDWKEHWTGIRHIGIVVSDVDDVIKRLSSAGFEIDHWGGEHPYRKSVYYFDKHNVEFEFIQYLSEDPLKKNDYKL